MKKNKDGDKNSSVKKHIGKYKFMLKNKNRYYFDVEEFEDIIEYFINKEKLAEAENALNYALNLHPGAFGLMLKQAQIFVESDKTRDALNLLTKLKALQPDEPEIYFWSGIVEISENNIENAEENFARLNSLKKDTDESIYLLIAFAYIKHGEFKHAVKYLKNALASNHENKYALYDLAYCYEKLKDFDNSAIYYKKYLELNPYEPTVWYNFGVINYWLQKYETAVEAYDFAIAINPKLSVAYYNKALIYNLLEEFDLAIETFEEFLNIEKNSIDGLNGIADSYRKSEKYEKAAEAYQKVLELDKNNIDALYGSAAVCALTDNNFEGLNYVIRALRIEKRNPELYYLGAKIFSRLGYERKAEDHYLKAVEINPYNTKYWKSFSELFFDTDTEKSVEILKHATALNTDNSELLYLLAEYLFVSQKFEQAEKYLAKAAKLNPEYLKIFYENCPQAVQTQKIASIKS